MVLLKVEVRSWDRPEEFGYYSEGSLQFCGAKASSAFHSLHGLR